jgi:hypothetical protein
MLKVGKNGQKLAKYASLHLWKLKTHVKAIFAFKVIFFKRNIGVQRCFKLVLFTKLSCKEKFLTHKHGL